MANYQNDDENAENGSLYQSTSFKMITKMGNYQNEDSELYYNAENKLLYQSTSFTNRFMSAIRPFNFVKLDEISNLIYESINCGNKEIYNCYQFLIEDIFSTEKETNWNLLIEPDSLNHSNELQILYNFLHADGYLFNLIKFLMSDSSLKYFFPVSKLSLPSKMLIEQGITPNYYLNKIYSDSMSIYPTKIQLNPFEFFLFHFTYYVKDLKKNVEFNNEGVDNLYINLLKSYLFKFLPANNNKYLTELNQSNTQNSLWKSLSSTTSNLLHFGHHNSDKSNQESTSLNQKPSLLNIKPLQNYSFKQVGENNSYNQKSFDSVGSVVYKCETIINILTEMWLNIKLPTNLNKKKSLSSTNLIQNNCPNVIYMMCVRDFIKRAHFFANSQTDKSLVEMGNMPAFENHELDDIKKSVWTSKYQIPKRFYNFMKLSFEHWPCDSSFRVPLETWLSFIQPWRYNEFSQKNLINETKNLNNSADNQSLNNLNKWKNFIQENILFYTTIYKEFLSRFLNLDLLSFKNVNMLFRIVKVFSQLNLSELIKEAESNCETVVSSSWLASATLRGSLLSPNLRNNSQSICHKDLSFTNLLEDNEKTGFVYVSFFSEEIRKMVIKLISKIKFTIEKVEKFEKSTQEKQKNKHQITQLFTSFFNTTSSFDLEEKQNLDEMAKIRVYLSTVQTKFAQLYEIDLNEFLNEEENFDSSIDTLCDRVYHSMSQQQNDESTMNKELTINQTNFNLFTLDNIEYNGNPDLQPVRTYEVYYLVLFFIYLSNLINGYYEDSLKRFYESDGFVGWFAKLVLAAPHEYTVIEKNGIQPQKRIINKLPPRINLRFLASIPFYVYLLFFYVFIKIFLFSKTLLLVTSFTLIIGLLIVKLFIILNSQI